MHERRRFARRFHNSRQSPKHSRHTAGGCYGIFGILDLAQPLFQHCCRRIGIARILEALNFFLEGAFRLFCALIDIARIHKQGFGGLIEETAQQASPHRPSTKSSLSNGFRGRREKPCFVFCVLIGGIFWHDFHVCGYSQGRPLFFQPCTRTPEKVSTPSKPSAILIHGGP